MPSLLKTSAKKVKKISESFKLLKIFSRIALFAKYSTKPQEK